MRNIISFLIFKKHGSSNFAFLALDNFLLYILDYKEKKRIHLQFVIKPKSKIFRKNEHRKQNFQR